DPLVQNHLGRDQAQPMNQPPEVVDGSQCFFCFGTSSQALKFLLDHPEFGVGVVKPVKQGLTIESSVFRTNLFVDDVDELQLLSQGVLDIISNRASGNPSGDGNFGDIIQLAMVAVSGEGDTNGRHAVIHTAIG